MHEMNPSNPVNPSATFFSVHPSTQFFVLTCFVMSKCRLACFSRKKICLICFVKSAPYLVLDEKYLLQFMILFMFSNKT